MWHAQSKHKAEIIQVLVEHRAKSEAMTEQSSWRGSCGEEEVRYLELRSRMTADIQIIILSFK
jgi:hypothetical protein